MSKLVDFKYGFNIEVWDHEEKENIFDEEYSTNDIDVIIYSLEKALEELRRMR